VGGGLFGCYAALVLADRGYDVVLVEQGSRLLTRASLVNQARLHTGLHYPRSLLTALEALKSYLPFRNRFPTAIRDFEQVYAVAAHNSKTTGSEFAAFVVRLGVPAEEIDPDRWFHPGTVSRAFRVEEPSFDAGTLRTLLEAELRDAPTVEVRLASTVTGGSVGADGVRLTLEDGTTLAADRVVIATYAGTNALREALGLAPLPLTFELAEVVLGHVGPELRDRGFTVMDGPFWSLMPFGHGSRVSLTSVGLTPVDRRTQNPAFDCQSGRDRCSPLALDECTGCPTRPASSGGHQQQQMARFLRLSDTFRPAESLLTVKAVLSAAEVDDARPTVVQREAEGRVMTVISGKVSTLFDLDGAL
jgi:glycine/D-amino acid oxidase-like deaminating enzyme